MSISIILPVYNEKEQIKKNIPVLLDYMKGSNFDFEILICDNGSTDYKSINFSDKRIRFLRTDKKGIGNGIRLGIQNARYELGMFYAIDLPFGTSILKESIDKMEKDDVDIVIGSKGHLDSINNASPKRKMFSRIYNLLINIFFDLDVKDSQGSLLFRIKDVKKYLGYLDSEDAFFETQILIYGKRIGLKLVEIPVKYDSPRKGSKINPAVDGLRMFRQLLDERKKYKERK
jgi:glycosyltransferase involved in cell wall biosynthesis